MIIGITEKKNSPSDPSTIVKPIPSLIGSKRKTSAAIDAIATNITGLRPIRSESQPMTGVDTIPAKVSSETCHPIVNADISSVSFM